MVGVYKLLTDFLPMIEEDKIGDWAIDRVNDGTPEHPIQMPFVNYSRLVRKPSIMRTMNQETLLFSRA